MDGTQTRKALPLGAPDSVQSNRIFVNLRTGKIAQTSNTQLPGFKSATTKNKDNTFNHFYAKEKDHVTGYVTEIRWHTHKLPDGTMLTGWNVTINTTEEVYVLHIGSNDRPFHRFMACCLNVDFEQPVMFLAFMGKNKEDKPQKVLLLSQEFGADNKPIWIKPALEEKWLSRVIIDKLKEKSPLTDYDERNVSRNPDGTFNKDYPYIHQKVDGKWSFDTWDDHLQEAMRNIVIPNVEAADKKRGLISTLSAASADVPDEYTGPPAESTAAPYGPDDDIPF